MTGPAPAAAAEALGDARFYRAVEAIVGGDLGRLRALLGADPGLARARSPAEHQATLLHYVAANGVEDEWCRQAANAPALARALLDAGADADATCQIYGGGPQTTPLVAAASYSYGADHGNPEAQPQLVEALVKGGARVDGLEDDGIPLAIALGFFYPRAAAALARCGARLDHPVYAAGVGDLETLDRLWSAGPPWPGAGSFEDFGDPEEVLGACLGYAAMGGFVGAMEWARGQGADLERVVARNAHGAPLCPLHLAAAGGDLAATRWLLARGVRRDQPDGSWGSTPAQWAEMGGHHEVAALIAAG